MDNAWDRARGVLRRGRLLARPAAEQPRLEDFDAGEHEQALDAFERALEVRLRDPENTAAIEHAREAVAEGARLLGRPK